MARASRKWIVDELDENGDLSRAALQEAFLEAEVIMHRMGGALSVVAMRRELDNGMYEPIAVAFQWDSFSPAQRERREQPVALPADPDVDVEVAA